jgi:hypothetical protein
MSRRATHLTARESSSVPRERGAANETDICRPRSSFDREHDARIGRMVASDRRPSSGPRGYLIAVCRRLPNGFLAALFPTGRRGRVKLVVSCTGDLLDGAQARGFVGGARRGSRRFRLTVRCFLKRRSDLRLGGATAGGTRDEQMPLARQSVLGGRNPPRADPSW